MKKILIVNQPLNNRGDESAHKALVRSILQYIPNAEVKVLFIQRNQNSINQITIQSNRVSYVNLPSLISHCRSWLYMLLFIAPFVLKD